MRINLKIESRELDNEVQVQKVLAIKKQDNNSSTYRYIDELSKTFVEIFENSVIISREGNIRSKMILKEGKTTNFDYSSEYMKTSFELFTKKLIFLENGFEVSYVISQRGNLINEINLSILEK